MKNSCRWCGKRIAQEHMKCKACRSKLDEARRRGQEAARITREAQEEHEPTEEELEAIIAEQRANLPEWWKQEVPG